MHSYRKEKEIYLKAKKRKRLWTVIFSVFALFMTIINMILNMKGGM